MNSKTLRYSIWHALRQKAWFVAISLVLLLFVLPIRVAMKLQGYLSNIAHAPSTEMALEWQADMADFVARLFSQSTISISFVMLLLAFAAAQCFFSYLHGKRELDFYHSLPQPRGLQLAGNYIAGVLAVFVPYIINLLLTVLIVLLMDGGGLFSAGMVLDSLAYQLIYFLAIFSLCVLAAMLSGNSVVQGILSVIFLGIGPILVLCYQNLREVLQPAWYSQLIDFNQLVINTSPAASYVGLAREAALSNSFPWGIVVQIVVATALCWLLCRLRPSEAAGRALAFPVSRPLIKYPVMLSLMALGGLAMHSVGDSSGSYFWLLVGVALAGFLSAQIMEIVYHASFRAITKKLIPMGVVVVLCCGGCVLVGEDVVGYNSYVPQSAEVESVEVRFYGVAHDAYGDYPQYGSYGSSGVTQISEAQLLQRGQIEDAAAVAAVCEIATKLAAKSKEATYIPEAGNTFSMVVRYQMADGSVKVRDYSSSYISVMGCYEQFVDIYADPLFRQSQYALFGFAPEQIRMQSVDWFNQLPNYEEYNYGYSQTLLNADVSALLAVYAEELVALDAVQRFTTLPLAQLNFLLFEEDPGYVQFNYDYYAVELPSRSFSYPVYACMTKTLAALASLGYEQPLPDFDAIEYVELYTLADDADADEAAARGGLPAATTETVGIYTPMLSGVVSTQKIDDGEWTRETISDPAQIAVLWQQSYSNRAFMQTGFPQPLAGSYLTLYYRYPEMSYYEMQQRNFLAPLP